MVGKLYLNKAVFKKGYYKDLMNLGIHKREK